MPYRVIQVELGANVGPYSAGLQAAATETRTFAEQAAAAGRIAEQSFMEAAKGTGVYTEAVNAAGQATKIQAQANVAAAVQQREALQGLAVEYAAVAAAAEKGSAQQLVAMRLQADAARQLGATQAAVSAERVAQSEAGMGADLLRSKVDGLIQQNAVLSQGFNEVTVAGGGTSQTFGDVSAASDAAGVSLAKTSNFMLAGVAALLALGYGAEQGVKKLMDIGAETRALQRVTGASSETASRFNYELKSVGINSEAAAPLMARFSRNIADHADKFDQAGVAIRKNNDGTNDVIGTYRNLQDRLRGTNDATERQAITFALLGRGATTLGADLSLSKERIKELGDQSDRTGATMSQKTNNQTLELSRSMRLLGAEATGVELQLGQALLPTLLNVANAATNAGEGINSAAEPIGGLNAVVDFGISSIPILSSGLDLLQGHYKDAALHATGLSTIVGHVTGMFGDQAKTAADVAAGLEDQQLATAGLLPFAKALGESEETAALEGDKLTKAASELKFKLDDLGAPLGLTGEQLLQLAGNAAAAEAAAKRMVAAVEASSKAFDKDFSITDTFGARAMESAAKAATKSADSVVKDDGRVADATQHVADLQAQYAEKATADREAYARKVEQANQAMTDADLRYADTVAAENQRVADADQRLADERINAAQRVQDAKDRLVSDDESGSQAVRDAQQRLRDLQQRNSATSPEQAAAISKAQELRRAQEDVARAQKRAADTHEKNVEAIAEAEAEGVKTVAKAQEAADRARVEQGRNVAKAEESVVKARETQNRLAEEGQTVGRQTLQQQTEMRKAVESVTKAQEGLGGAIGDAGEEQRKAIKLTTEDVRKFYEQSTGDAEKFAQNIHGAIERGYDPAFIAKLLEQGPKEAAPILELMAEQNDTNLRDRVNKGEETLRLQGLHMQDMAKAVQVAVNTVNGQTRQDFDLEMKALVILAENGGHMTAQKLAEKLGVGVKDVLRIAGEYGGAMKAGIDPLLEGIGSPKIPYAPPQLGADPFGGGTSIGFAEGGYLPRDARLQPPGTLVQWAEPETQGEYFIPRAPDRRPRAVGVLAQAADDFGYTMLRKMADGGFILPGDVPPPPDFGPHGNMVGYSAGSADRHLYDLVVEFVKAHPPHAAEGSGSGYGYQALIDFINSKGIDNTVTSTLRPGSITSNGNLSEHAGGWAADFAGDMPAITAAFNSISGSMRELIHDPGGSIKMGQPVDPSFWGSVTWGQHGNHVHASTFHGPGDGPGVPTAADAARGGGGSNREIGQRMAAARGWTGDQWASLEKLWTRESDWDAGPGSVNPSSGAYGIPQANPSGGQGHPYALNDPTGQIQWGLEYIADRYGDPNAAWAFWQGHNWYAQGGLHGRPGLPLHAAVMDQGGVIQPGANLIWNGTGRGEHVPNPSASAIDYDRLARTIVSVSEGHGHALFDSEHEFAGVTSRALYERQKAGLAGR